MEERPVEQFTSAQNLTFRHSSRKINVVEVVGADKSGEILSKSIDSQSIRTSKHKNQLQFKAAIMVFYEQVSIFLFTLKFLRAKPISKNQPKPKKEKVELNKNCGTKRDF